MKFTTGTPTAITRSCGHVEEIELDQYTASRKAAIAAQPCLACQPTFTVLHYCGHEGSHQRTLGDEITRRRDRVAMQDCPACCGH